MGAELRDFPDVRLQKVLYGVATDVVKTHAAEANEHGDGRSHCPVGGSRDCTCGPLVGPVSGVLTV